MPYLSSISVADHLCWQVMQFLSHVDACGLGLKRAFCVVIVQLRISFVISDTFSVVVSLLL